MRKRPVVLLLAAILISGCATIKETYNSSEGFVLKRGRRPREPLSTIAVTHGVDGEQVEITSPLIPGITWRGVVGERTSLSTELMIEQARLFSNWANGWTEGFYEASGRVVITRVGDRWRCAIAEPLELWGITGGEIRYQDTYYQGDEGLSKVRARVDRIVELTALLSSRGEMTGPYGDWKKATAYGPGLRTDLVPYLFPEAPGTRRLTGRHPAPELGGPTTRGADIRWHTEYTEMILPESLWELRNSGTLYRDWEEAPFLIQSFLNLDHYLSQVLEGDYVLKPEGPAGGMTEWK